MISLCMITKNEEQFLETCLNSVKDLVAEIIIGDTGSTDKTIEIAKKFGAKVIDLPWNNNFSEARNAVLAQATQPWILVLDGDEMLDQQNHEFIRESIKNPEAQGYSFVQITYTNDETLENFSPVKEDILKKGFKGMISCNIIRLFRNDPSFRFVGAVHEYIEDSIGKKGKIGITTYPIYHYQELKGTNFFKKKQVEYLKIYEQHIDTYPNKGRAYRHMGNICYTFLKDYDRSIAYFQQALEIKQDARSYLGLGWCYLQKQEYTQAEEMFKKGLEVDRQNATLWLSRGKLYILMQKPRAARTCFENALKLQPDNQPVKAMLDNLNAVLGT
ncbi:MAG: glycosyltransferase [Nanoarchaeota archaeon]